MNYIEQLQAHQLKATPQRLLIIENLDKMGHMNIDDLYASLKQRFPSLSLATIYKNINIMIDKLFLSEVKIPHQKSVYELSKKEHAHAVCKACGAIMDIEIETQSLMQEVAKRSHYELDEEALIFSGICPKCQ